MQTLRPPSSGLCCGSGGSIPSFPGTGGLPISHVKGRRSSPY